MTSRFLRGLALLLYAASLFLPVGNSAGAQSVGFLVAYNCFCGMIVVPVAFVEQPGSLLTLSCAALLAISMSHLLLWWSWLVHALRRPLHAAVTSGLASVLWLALLPIASGPTNPDYGIGRGGWGFWLCLAGMVGSCATSMLRYKAVGAESPRSEPTTAAPSS